MPKSIDIRLGTTGGTEVRRTFDDIGATGDATARRLKRSFDRASEDIEAASRRQAAAAAKIAAITPQTPMQARINEAVGTGYSQPAGSAREAAGSILAFVQAQDALNERAARIRDLLDPAAAAQARYTREVRETKAVYQEGALTVDQYIGRIRQLQAANSGAAGDVRALQQAQDAMNERAARIRDLLDPAAAAQARYTREVRETKEALRQKAITVDEYIARIRQMQAANVAQVGALQQVGRGNAMAKAGMQQLSFQVGDVATQMGSGTSIMQIYAQQSGQVFQAVGMMTNGAKGFLAVMGGPWGQVINAAIVVGSMLAMKWFETDDAQKKTTRSIKESLAEMRNQSAQADVNRAATEQWARSIMGAADAQRELNKELKAKFTTDLQAARDKVSDTDARLPAFRADRDKTERDTEAARQEVFRARARVDALPRAGTSEAQSNTIMRARERLSEANAKLALSEERLRKTTTNVTSAETGRRDARFAIIASEVSGGRDAAGRAEQAYQASLTKLQADRAQLDELEYRRRLDRIQTVRDAAIKAAQEESKASKSPLTDFISPVEGRVGSGFGQRARPTAGASTQHNGVDIPAALGTKVMAAAGGIVIHAGRLGGLGNAIIVDHGGGTITQYGHLSKIVTAKGAKVGQGEKIGEVGSTGVSTGNHLHYGVKVGGRYVDPTKARFRTDETKVDLAAVRDFEREQRELATTLGDVVGRFDQAREATDRYADTLKKVELLKGKGKLTPQQADQARDGARDEFVDARAKVFKLDSVEDARPAYDKQDEAKTKATAKAKESRERARDRIADQEEGIVLLRAELGLVAANDNQREITLAKLRLILDLKREGIDAESDEGRAILDNADKRQAIIDTLERQQDAWRTVKDFGRSAIDTLFDPKSAQSWGDRVKSVLGDLKFELIKLALLNPLKNMLFGEKNTTLGSLFGGKGIVAGDNPLGRILGGLGGLFGGGKKSGTVDSLLGIIPKFARGTHHSPAGTALVGEEGPELVEMPRGSRVTTAADTRRLLGANDNRGGNTVNIYADRAVLADEVRGWVASGMEIAATRGAAGGAAISEAESMGAGQRRLGRTW